MTKTRKFDFCRTFFIFILTIYRYIFIILFRRCENDNKRNDCPVRGADEKKSN